MRIFSLTLLTVIFAGLLSAQEPILIMAWEGEGETWESGTVPDSNPEQSISKLNVYTSHPDSGLIWIALPTPDRFGREEGWTYCFSFDDRAVFPLRTISPPSTYIDSTGTGFLLFGLDTSYVFPEEMQWIYSGEFYAFGSTVPDESDSVTLYAKYSGSTLWQLSPFPEVTATPRITHWAFGFDMQPRVTVTWLLDDLGGLIQFRQNVVGRETRFLGPDTLLLSVVAPDSIIENVIDITYLEVEQPLVWYFIEVSENTYDLNLWRVDDDTVNTLTQIECSQPPIMLCAPSESYGDRYFYYHFDMVPDWIAGWVTEENGQDQICWLGSDNLVYSLLVDGSVTQFRIEQEVFTYDINSPGPGGAVFYIVWSEYSEEDDSTRLYYMLTEQILDVEETGRVHDVPNRFEISPVYPNPFNSNVTVSISLPTNSDLRVAIYNILGQEVAILVNGRYIQGYHRLQFDAGLLSSGIYFIHAVVPGKMNEVQKAVYMK